MKTLRNLILMLTVFIAAACSSVKGNEKKSAQNIERLKKAYFASGCFWCAEAIFEKVVGVKEVVSGYSGGKIKSPTYKQVCSGKTMYAEAVEVYYDPQIITYGTLLKVFFGQHDPTTLNRQGPDVGPQYRSIVFYQNKKEKELADNYIKELDAAGEYESKIVTEVIAFELFYKAEEYHQDYEKNHPENPYIQEVSVPRIKRFEAKFPELLK